jgi:hypothetical protein
LLLPSQIEFEPEIVPSVAGIVFTVIAKFCADEDPHALFAVTVILPLVEDAVVLIEFVEEVPVQPLDIVQV